MSIVIYAIAFLVSISGFCLGSKQILNPFPKESGLQKRDPFTIKKTPLVFL